MTRKVFSVAEQFEIRYEDENIWLTQKMLAKLYGVVTHTINYHLKKVFADAELSEDSVIRKFRITAADGKNYQALPVTASPELAAFMRG